MNIAAIWIYGYTPPNGLILNSEEYLVPSPILISTVQASFFKHFFMVHNILTPTPCYVGMVQLCNPLNSTHIVPPSVYSTNSGMLFRKWVSRRNPNISIDDNSTLGHASGKKLMVNGFPIMGYIYDTNGCCRIMSGHT